MFCHGWQNKASRATDGSLNAGHVTPRKSNSDTLRLFLFSYNGTKINSGFAQNAIHRPATHHLDGRRMSTTNQHLSNILYLKVLFHNNVSILNTKSTFYKQLLNSTFIPIMCHPHFSSISSFIPANPNFSYIGRPISVASKEIASIPLFFAFSTNNDSV